MKKILRNFTTVLVVSLMISNTCVAAEENIPQTYYDGMTIQETVAVLATQAETEKATKPEGTYNYNIFSTSNTIIIVKNLIYDGYPGVTITSYIYDDVNKMVTCTVTSVMGQLNTSKSKTYAITVEIK